MNFISISRTALSMTALLVIVAGCATAPPKPKTIHNDGYAYLKEYLAWEIERKMNALRFSRKTVSGYELLLAYHDGQAYPMASNINPASLPRPWQSMAGEYEPANPDPNLNPRKVRLTVDEKALILSFALDLPMREDSAIYFQPISATEAITMGIGRDAGETMCIIDVDGRPGLYFSGFQLRKIAD